jgi:hypothetical protein
VKEELLRKRASVGPRFSRKEKQVFRGCFVCGKKSYIARNCTDRKDVGSNVNKDNNGNKNFNYSCKAVVPNLFRCEPHFRDFKIKNAPLLPMQRYETPLLT